VVGAFAGAEPVGIEGTFDLPPGLYHLAIHTSSALPPIDLSYTSSTAFFDVRLVPEPSTAMLLGLGVASLARLRRSRRAS
jgi:hypothetical protein